MGLSAEPIRLGVRPCKEQSFSLTTCGRAKRNIPHRAHWQLIRNPTPADRRLPPQPQRNPHFSRITLSPPTQVRLNPVQLRQSFGDDSVRLPLVATIDDTCPDVAFERRRILNISRILTLTIRLIKHRFDQAGKIGLRMNSELLPWTARCMDEMAFIRSMHTEAFNHELAITLEAGLHGVSPRHSRFMATKLAQKTVRRSSPHVFPLAKGGTDYTRWQATWCPGWISRSAGASVRHFGSAMGQRG
ncbi:MAG: DUF1501 domain-containing protein [Verrucomicrobia bacterium]|nr:DUF1501 domain-containing protein [Verrucomicrobiota bacterium]